MISETNTISESVHRILQKIPPGVLLLAAAKTRTLAEVQAVIEAGVNIIGYNYVQEAEPFIETIGNRVEWHMIGHLQRNKSKKAVSMFDMIETVDSLKLAKTLDRDCGKTQKTMPVLVEVNSGREENKTGVMPEEVEELVTRMSRLTHLRVKGLMTMGPRFGDPEASRPYFKETRRVFEQVSALHLPDVDMHFLSMGMSNSYQIAIEEGANIIRIGTRLFGERENQ